MTVSLLEIPLCCDLFRKRIGQKNFLLEQQTTELYQLSDGLQNFFVPNSLIFQKSSGKEEEEAEEGEKGNRKPLCFSSKPNNNIVFFVNKYHV